LARRIRYEIEPMTLGNMRELGVRSRQPDRSPLFALQYHFAM
jgi:hypothetical protein